MILPRATIICWISDRSSHVAVDKAARGGEVAIVYRCDSLKELLERSTKSAPAVIVVELALELPVAQHETAVRAIRRAAPGSYCVGIVSFAATTGDEIVSLVRAGLDAVSLRESGTLAMDLAKALRLTHQASVIPRLATELRLTDCLHAEAKAVVDSALQSESWPNVAIVARMLGLSSRELQRRFVDAGLGRPHDLLQTTRWLLASAALRQPGLTRRVVARSLGFSSVAALRDSVRRSLKMPLDTLESDAAARSLQRALTDRFGRIVDLRSTVGTSGMSIIPEVNKSPIGGYHAFL
jgi:AraC-like DNA-binding protein